MGINILLLRSDRQRLLEPLLSKRKTHRIKLDGVEVHIQHRAAGDRMHLHDVMPDRRQCKTLLFGQRDMGIGVSLK